MNSDQPDQPEASVALNDGAADGADPSPHQLEGDGFRLQVSRDRMAIYLECDTTGKDVVALADAILNRLGAFGVRKPPEKIAFRAWLNDHAALSPKLENVPVCEGVPPKPSVDGRIRWDGDFFNPGFLVDEVTGRVDFRKRLGQRNVQAGQLLATVMQPVAGADGIDVFGNVIPMSPPKSVQIVAGENVRADSTIAAFYATITGRIRWDDETLSVDELYKVEGDVGLETGDIVHHGAVVVSGDVLRGASLEAAGDIEVMGVVDGARIHSGGMVHVHGGITGAAGTRVTAAGGIHAKYLLDADVQSDADIVVEGEIMHAQVATRGALLAPQSRAIGGRIVALGGIEVGQAGSPASVPTELIAGLDFSLVASLDALRHELALKRQNVDRIKTTVAPLHGKIGSLPEKSKKAVRTLVQELPKLEAEIVALRRHMKSLQSASRAAAYPVVLVRGRLFSETRLTIQHATMLVREEVPGPVKAISVDEQIRLSITGMRTIARGRREALNEQKK